jgi:hypothetical protein
MIVIFRKEGQLGNRLFNFANFIAFAAANGLRVSNPSFCEYAPHFKSTRGDLLCRFPPRRHPWFSRLSRIDRVRDLVHYLTELMARIVRKLGFPRRLAQVIALDDDAFYVLDDNAQAREPFHTSLVTFVGGLQFRAISAMRAHRETIARYFEPVPEHQARVDEVVNRARKNCDVLVGVHIRGGDYAAHLGGRYKYRLEDYRGLMSRVKGLLPDRRTGFLICSNDPLKPELFDGFDYHFGPNHFLQDMYALARCDYILGPPSTYSLWASFYGGARLFFIQDPREHVTLEMFRDYFGIVGAHAVQKNEAGEQFVEINGARYGLVFPTASEYLAL